jgi:hypothetical protein
VLVINSSLQLICDFLVHVASPNKIVDRQVETVERSNHKRHDIMLLYI